ncbi:MAG: putative DNA-binding domain-containing protein [Devosiaceae bacterium]|nr:putative DNA-binding domain-containing protein [Devosiaceae bacterium MH13]
MSLDVTSSGGEREGQGAFAHALRAPDAPVPHGIARANGADPTEAFNIYRNNVVASLADALQAAFPITAQMLGDGLSRALTADFARAHPPRSPVLGGYGAGFPRYLANHEATKSRPFLAEMALLERLYLDSYHAADAAALDGATLAALDPETLSAGRLVLHPATRLVRFRFPIAEMHAIEQAAMRGEDVGAARSALDLRRGSQALITRPAYQVSVNGISPGASAFLKACEAGDSFADAAQAGFEAEPAFDLQTTLSDALSLGAFSHFSPLSTPS